MRVVHLSTNDICGGAARSAWRLHKGLRKIGVESRMVVRTKNTDDPDVHAADDGTAAFWQDQIATPWLQLRQRPGAPFFTSSITACDVTAHPWLRDADIIHLHWVASWLDSESIARVCHLGKPVFWTFHDLWAVTGGSHYPGRAPIACQDWQDGATLGENVRPIARAEFERKRANLSGLKLNVISPSHWLASCVQASEVGRGWRTHVVPYGIDIAVFRPGERRADRGRWGIPPEAVCLLFGCMALDDERKGLNELKRALKLAGEDPAFAATSRSEGVRLVLFGSERPPLDEFPMPVMHVGPLSAESDLASLYRAVDAYLCPSLEDNLPNTVLESLACGTPVIGFATGGIPDVVEDGQNGDLAPCGDCPELARRLIAFVTDDVLRSARQKFAREAPKDGFALETQAERVLELYRRALPPAGAGAVTRQPPPPPDVVRSQVTIAENPWLLAAVQEALLLHKEHSADLRRALEQTRTQLEVQRQKLAAAKEERERWKNEAREAKRQLEKLYKKPWLAWFDRRRKTRD